MVNLAKALGAEAEELVPMAGKVPESIRRRVIQRPDAFRKLAALGDEELDSLMAVYEGEPLPGARTRR